MNAHASNIQDPGPFLSADLLTAGAGSRPLIEDLTFTMGRGEQWILTGEAGSGKSTLGKALCGLHFCRGDLRIAYDPGCAARPNALYVDQWYHFKDHTGLSSGFYYQQRYNSQDSDSAGTLIEDLVASTGASLAEAMEMLGALHVAHRANASLVQLSSGEHKKLQLARAFLSRPQLLVLDNPYVGLDLPSCANMESLLEDIVSKGAHIIIIGDTARVPAIITHIATLGKNRLDIVEKDTYNLIHDSASSLPAPQVTLPAYLSGNGGTAVSFREFVRMDGVNIRYEGKQVLTNIHWRVRKGERWWVRGENGAGKSTLLSLVVGDNPQAYANPIYLFDLRRGSGESIWEIKRKIGYISPELHWYFDQQATCADAVASGFFDTTGLYGRVSVAQQEKVDEWLEALGLEAFASRRLQDLSLGNQRLTLLARALVKDPPVLVLDEPCQGLDNRQAERFLQIVDKLMESRERTLVYVTHRQDQLPPCIEHVLWLEGGRQAELQNTYHTTKTVQR